MVDTVFLLIGLAIGLLGLWAPGHFLQRLVVNRADVAVSFVLSLWLLFTLAVVFQIINIPIRFWTVGPALGVLAGLFGIARHKYQSTVISNSTQSVGDTAHSTPGLPPHDLATLSKNERLMALTVLGLCVLAFISALGSAPLHFYDFPIRWNLYPTLLYETGNLDWYPAQSADAFAAYIMPDAMPQIVGTGVWWLYASCNSTTLWISGLFALLQYFLVGWAAGQLVRALGGSVKAQVIAGLCIMACPLVMRSIALRQEAGLFTLVTLTLLAAILHLQNQKQDAQAPQENLSDNPANQKSTSLGLDGSLILAGLLGGAAMSVREYSGYLLLPGVLLVFQQTRSLKSCGALIALSLCAGGLWFVHVWHQTGNPFYTLVIPGVFESGSPVWTNVVSGINQQVSGLNYSAPFRQTHLGQLAVNVLPIGLLTFVGMAAIKKRWALTVSMILLIVLWHWAGSTSAGGYEFALRVMLPGLALGIVLGVVFIAETVRLDRPRVYPALMGLTGLLAVHAGLMLTVDRYYWQVPVGQWAARAEALREADNPFEETRILTEAIKKFPAQLAGAKVLCTNSYIGAELRKMPVRLIPLWSPEVSFLFDPALSIRQKEELLLNAGIRYAVLEPSDYFWFGSFQQAGLEEHSLSKWQLHVPLSGDKGLFELPALKASPAPAGEGESESAR